MKGWQSRPQVDRKTTLEKLLGTTLSHNEYVQLKETWFTFWQSPGKFAKDPNKLIYSPAKTHARPIHYSLNDVKAWLESIRS